MEARIGSLEAGKEADAIAVDLSAPSLAPCYDPVSHLVHACGREHVSDVWVAGERLVAGRALKRIDAAALDARAGLWRDRIA